jgi:hypothetical protein
MANLTLMRIYRSQGRERRPATDDVGTLDGISISPEAVRARHDTRHKVSVVELGVVYPILVPAVSSLTETVSGSWSGGACIISRASTNEYPCDYFGRGPFEVSVSEQIYLLLCRPNT